MKLFKLSEEEIGKLFDQYLKNPTVYWVSYAPLELLFNTPLEQILSGMVFILRYIDI
jgi:hypothetical protein